MKPKSRLGKPRSKILLLWLPFDNNRQVASPIFRPFRWKRSWACPKSVGRGAGRLNNRFWGYHLYPAQIPIYPGNSSQNGVALNPNYGRLSPSFFAQQTGSLQMGTKNTGLSDQLLILLAKGRCYLFAKDGEEGVTWSYPNKDIPCFSYLCTHHK